MPIGAALIGAAVLGAGANIIAGNKANKAIQDSTAQQIAESRRQYDQDRADLAPWRTTGGAAMMKLGDLYGLNGKQGGIEGSGFFESPDYQYRKEQSLKALDRYQSARGMWNSGATRVAAVDTAGKLASAEYGDWYNRLAGLAGAGQGAANTTVAAGQSNSSNIINAIGQAGNARASSYANTGAAISNGANNALSAYLFSKGGGFGGGANGLWGQAQRYGR